MTSEDVIHSFFVPAFRTKADVVPGRYSTTWFKPPSPASTTVLRRVLRHQPFRHDRLDLRHGAAGLPGVAERRPPPGSLAERREAVPGPGLRQLPQGRRPGRCPSLGPYGSQVQLADGAKVKADEAYIRESICNPSPRSWPATSR
jgi:cytochrome c oxidase subunit II